MAGLFDQFRRKVINSVWQEDPSDGEPDKVVDDLIALGVLMWVVAEADDKFLPEEKEKLKETLRIHSKITDKDMPVVLRAIEEAALERIDIHRFTNEVNKDLLREKKVEIVENLFRVGCIDQELDIREEEAIRQISNLFRLDHNEFIDAKIKIKKEFGMDTSGL